MKNHYKLIYESDLELEAEWLERTAINKVNSISYLINNNNIYPNSILELGCGTGAIIKECQKRGISNKYTGLDYSYEAINYLKINSKGINTIVADMTDANIRINDFYDVIILSHVLEHIQEPGIMIKSIINKFNFSYIIIEVPLEDLLVSKFKGVFIDRKKNKAGHVNFFSSKTIKDLLLKNDLKIIDYRQYLPILNWDTVNFWCKKDKCSKLIHIFKILTSFCLPIILKPIWRRLYYSHLAFLCAKSHS